MEFSYPEGELIIADVPYVLKEANLEYENWVLKFNTSNLGIDHLKFRYPDSYREFLDDPNLRHYNSTFTPSGQEIISLPASDSLIIISEKENKIMFAGVEDKMEYFPGTTTQEGE